MIPIHFTTDEQRNYFERLGYKVELREYRTWERYTHGWYEEEAYEALSVKVGEEWHKMTLLFDKVMDLKLKLFLLDRGVDDYIIINETATDNER